MLFIHKILELTDYEFFKRTNISLSVRALPQTFTNYSHCLVLIVNYSLPLSPRNCINTSYNNRFDILLSLTWWRFCCPIYFINYLLIILNVLKYAKIIIIKIVLTGKSSGSSVSLKTSLIWSPLPQYLAFSSSVY